MNKMISILLMLALVLSSAVAFAETATPTTISMLHITEQHGTDYGEYAAWDIIEEKLGIVPEFVHVDPEVAVEKFNILLQSGEMPDLVIQMKSYCTTSEVYSLAKEGYFMPLNDLIAEHAPNLQALLDNDPVFRSTATAPDGNIYVLPMKIYGPGQEVRIHTFVNSDFLKALNMEMPTTIDEVYAYLKGVKEQDVNGNGDPNDEIPLISTSFASSYDAVYSNIMAAFTPFSQKDNRYITDDGKVIYAPASDGWREGLKFFAKLYEEGLLYSESFSNNKAGVQAVAASGVDGVELIGMIPGHNFSCYSADASNTAYEHFEIMGALEGGTLPYDPSQLYQLENSISTNCKDPVAVIKLLDFLATQEGTRLCQVGVMGVNITEASEGAVTSDGKPAEYRFYTTEEREALGNSEQGANLTWGFCNYITEDTYAAEYVDTGVNMTWSHKFTDDYLDAVYSEDIPNSENYWNTNFYFSDVALADLALYETDLKNAVALANAEFVMGVRDIDDDKAWENYLAELESYGLSDYLRISQEEYDASR